MTRMALYPSKLSTVSLSKKRLSSSKGFSLVELLCVLAIMAILVSTSWSVFGGVVTGNALTNKAYQLSGIVQQARSLAISQRSYLWLGFHSYSKDGASAVLVVGLLGNGGLASDLQNNNYRFAIKPTSLGNVDLAAAGDYSNLPGLDKLDNTDMGSQAYACNVNVPGNFTATFSNFIVFSPDGQVGLPQADNGALQVYPCIGVGLNASPRPGNALRTVAVQVRGLSGQVSVFQQ